MLGGTGLVEAGTYLAILGGTLLADKSWAIAGSAIATAIAAAPESRFLVRGSIARNVGLHHLHRHLIGAPRQQDDPANQYYDEKYQENQASRHGGSALGSGLEKGFCPTWRAYV